MFQSEKVEERNLLGFVYSQTRLASETGIGGAVVHNVLLSIRMVDVLGAQRSLIASSTP
jgi:hypothetical protein